MLPSQISWHLAWSDLFFLFQSLHTAISAKDSLQQVIFGGENAVVCQNLQRVWQQFFEDVAYENGCVAEIDLVPTAQQIFTHSSYLNETNSGGLSNQGLSDLIVHQTNAVFTFKNVEAGVLLVTKSFCLWLQIRAVSGASWERRDDFNQAPLRVTGDLDRDTRSCWQATIVFDRQIIHQLLQESGWTTVAPHFNQPVSANQEQCAIQQFWQFFLQLTQGSSHLSLLGTVPQNQSKSEINLLRSMLQQMPVGMFQVNLDGSFLQANAAFCQLLGYSSTQLARFDLQAITQPDDFLHELEMIRQIVQYGEQRIFEKRFIRAGGGFVWVEVKLSLVGIPDDEGSFLLGFVTDLSDIRQVELERLQAIQEIQKRQEWEILLNNIASRIRSAVDLPTMLQNAAAELNQALGSDRVVVYQIFADQSGCCVSEAVNPLFPTMHGQHFGPDCLPPPYLEAYRVGRLWSVEDVTTANLAECHQTMLNQVQVKSMIATSILSMDESLAPDNRQLWGLLTVHQCDFTRHWTTDELHLVEAVANQLAIALEQNKLLNQLTTYTQELETRVSERTQSLERSLKFEQFIRSLTECLHRDSDESQLFETVVQGLVTILKVDACLVCLYNSQTDALEVKFEAFGDPFPLSSSFVEQHCLCQNLPNSLQKQLLHRSSFWCNEASQNTCILPFLLSESNQQSLAAMPFNELVCPMVGADHCLGILLILQSQKRSFDAAEIELIEQTIDYCLIALRQVTLYRQEHEQRLSAEYLRSFLEKSRDIYVEYDAQLRYLSINPTGCALLGRPVEDILGKTNQELFVVESHPLEELIQQAFNTAEQVYVDHEVVLPDGKRVFESVYAPITDPSGTVQRVLGVSRDISEFKHQWQILEQQNQQLAETTRIKEEFVATTSHELRTPLTAILGFSNVLMQEYFGELNPKQKDYIERIHSSGQHLLELINDILDLSRLESGRMELDLQAIFIPDICEVVIGLVQERADSQGLALDLELDPRVEWVVADPRRLKQMLLNLLSNAVKFTPKGTVGLKIYCDSESDLPSIANPLALASSAYGSPKNLYLVHFLVWDTGIGIAEADQRLLFSPFSQIDSSLARKQQGSGLGLVITQKLAELHGGWVSLESQMGVGTKLTITLPLRAAI